MHDPVGLEYGMLCPLPPVISLSRGQTILLSSSSHIWVALQARQGQIPLIIEWGGIPAAQKGRLVIITVSCCNEGLLRKNPWR